MVASTCWSSVQVRVVQGRGTLDWWYQEGLNRAGRHVITHTHPPVRSLIITEKGEDEEGPLITPLARQLMHEVTSACKGVDVVVLALADREGAGLPDTEDGNEDGPTYIRLSSDGSRFSVAGHEFPSAGQAALSCFKKETPSE